MDSDREVSFYRIWKRESNDILTLWGLDFDRQSEYRTRARAGIIEPHAATLKLPLPVRSIIFFFLFVSGEGRKPVFSK